MTNKPLEQILAEFRQFLQTPEEVKEMLKVLDRHKNRALTEKEYKALRETYSNLKARGKHLDFKELIQKMDERIHQDLDYLENKGPVLALELGEAESLVKQMVTFRYFADEFDLSSKKRLKRLKYIIHQKEFSNDTFYFDFRLSGGLAERVLRFVKKTSGRFLDDVFNLCDKVMTDISENKETAVKGAAITGVVLAGILAVYGAISAGNYLSEEHKKKMAEKRDAIVQKVGGHSRLAEALIKGSYDPESLSQIVDSPDKQRQVVLYKDNQIFLYNKEDNSVKYFENDLFDDISRVYWESDDDLVLVKDIGNSTKYMKLHMHNGKFIHLGGDVDSLKDISKVVYSPDRSFGAFFIRGRNNVFIFDDNQNYQLRNEMFDRINKIYWESSKVLAVDTPNCGHPLRIETDKIEK